MKDKCLRILQGTRPFKNAAGRQSTPKTREVSCLQTPGRLYGHLQNTRAPPRVFDDIAVSSFKGGLEFLCH